MTSISEMQEQAPLDFRRANGAPMWTDPETGKNIRGSRPSGWGKLLDDESALTNWRIDIACIGVAQSPALAAKWSVIDFEDRKTRGNLREEAIQGGRGNEASDTGTALHAMSVRYEDPADEWVPPEQYVPDLEAYMTEIRRYGLESIMYEVAIVNSERKAAGTADRIYQTTVPLQTPDGEWLDEGTYVIGDLKTGKKLDFSLPGYSVQMAIYAEGILWDVANDRPSVEQPEINQKWGLLVHLPVGHAVCEMLWVDLEIGAYGAYLVQEVRKWRSLWRKGEYDAPVAASPGLKIAEIASALDAEVVTIDEADTEWVELMTPWLQHRIDYIANHEEARKWLHLEWPEDVPTPKRGLAQPEHVTAILNVLDQVEAKYGLGFVEGNPSSHPSAHKGKVVRSNLAPSQQKVETTT